MEQNSQHKENLLIQIRESYGKVVYTYTTHLKMIHRLADKNKIIKYCQIGFSAISTGGFLGAIIKNEVIYTCIGGLFSTILLALNLFVKDFNLLEVIKKHKNVANDLWMIREDYLSLLTDFSILTEEEIMKKRDELQLRVLKIYKTAPETDKKSYEEAQKAIKYEEEQFFTSEEIDKMLPPHLRQID